jgi:hypothetical protein
MRLFKDTTDAEARSIVSLQAKWISETRAATTKPTGVSSKVLAPSKVPPPPQPIEKGKGKGLELLKPVSKVTPAATKRKDTATTEDDDVFEQTTQPAKAKATTTRRFSKKPRMPIEMRSYFVVGLGLLSAQEGSQSLQASAQQEAVKTAKAKVDKTKEKAKGRPKKLMTKKDKPEVPEIEIPEAIKQSIKESQKKKKTIHASKPKQLPGIYKVADDVLTRLKQYRSKRPINWDPLDLKDPHPDSAVRPKDEEHVQRLAAVQWAEKEQPKVVEWIVFQFNVSNAIDYRWHHISF